MEPVIGIISCGYMQNRQFVTESYIHAIEECGGIPILLPIISTESFYPYYSNICNGFLFCGGDDINPLLFGEEPLTDIGKIDTRTDIFHISFMKYALSSQLPILAICRGMQILNIALGGTIYQDLTLRPSPSLNHLQLSENREESSHKISISSNSMLYSFLGNTALVNSFHHQSIHFLGKGLKITAIASDGVIEAIESSENKYLCGLQWHPECMIYSSPPMKELIIYFIQKAKNSKNLHYISPDIQTYYQ